MLTVIIVRREGAYVHVNNVAKLLTVIIVHREGAYVHISNVAKLLSDNGTSRICDCIFEPLYGKSWELLVEVIDECLKLNPKCIVLTSVERRSGDGVDLFVNKLRDAYYCTFVSSVELISVDEGRNLELYLARGFI